MVNLTKKEHIQIVRIRARDYKFQIYLTLCVFFNSGLNASVNFSNTGSITSRTNEFIHYRGS